MPKSQSKKAPKYFNEKQGEYRSKLEDYCASKLKQNNIEFQYEPQWIELLPEFNYGKAVERWGKRFKVVTKVKSLGYTPDFVGRNWVIETKGFQTNEFRIRWKLFKKYLLDNGLDHYYLFLPSTKSEVDSVVKELRKNIVPRIDRRRKTLTSW